jgi:DNA-binding IscR family transcriptional regulator
MIAMQDMQVTPSNFQKLQRELELHIKLNRGGYLRTVAGKGGGVELTKP